MKHFSVGFGRVTKGIPRPRASAKTGAVLNGPNGPTYTVPSVRYICFYFFIYGRREHVLQCCTKDEGKCLK